MGQAAAIDTGNQLFKSAHSALTFAFHFSGQHYDRPAMNKLAAPTLGSGKGLVGLDGAGQAGMIRSRVHGLGVRMEAVLIARYAPATMPCDCRAPCCAGWKTNREWFDAVTELSDYVRDPLAGTAANGLMRRLYVERFFAAKGKRQTIDEIAERGDINRQTAGQHYSKVNKVLQELESTAQQAIDNALRDVGLLED